MSGATALAPVVLEGRIVRLEPLREDHAPALFEGAGGPEVWRFMPCPPPESIADTLAWIRPALAAQAAGRELPFAIVDRAADRPVGSTRFLDFRPLDGAVEIGWTWLAPGSQRTGANREAKRLLFEHAFERLGLQRVQLKTDRRNERSQRAIERLGAVREGVLRRDRRTWDGSWRDTVYFSVLADEWPAVRARLAGS